ncbi:MAG: winged helix-turn-helix transcriptional regulator, partial [Gammaproteobacteria bacterium]|nr:winged helix-turn-helix transcriptional regulator [Gammaproteobacteria bacterium]
MPDPASKTRADILQELKQRRSASQSELAELLGMTREAVRQHLALLEQEGWVRRVTRETEGRGRPTQEYRLTEIAESHFPKFYDQLTLELVESLAEKFGEAGLKTILAELADKQVAAWQPRLKEKN